MEITSKSVTDLILYLSDYLSFLFFFFFEDFNRLLLDFEKTRHRYSVAIEAAMSTKLFFRFVAFSYIPWSITHEGLRPWKMGAILLKRFVPASSLLVLYDSFVYFIKTFSVVIMQKLQTTLQATILINSQHKCLLSKNTHSYTHTPLPHTRSNTNFLSVNPFYKFP